MSNRSMPVDITEITEEEAPEQEDAPGERAPAPVVEEKKPAITGMKLIQDAEAAMAKVANTLSKGVASGDIFTTASMSAL